CMSNDTVVSPPNGLNGSSYVSTQVEALIFFSLYKFFGKIFTFVRFPIIFFTSFCHLGTSSLLLVNCLNSIITGFPGGFFIYLNHSLQNSGNNKR
ncbi:MAG: hypothetical protein PF482_03250, partial [Desulfobacteraceae bacterium]|nr:hypothetical protein [Desulfobacteraceae bacterium]